jgi:hypothetical protein
MLKLILKNEKIMNTPISLFIPIKYNQTSTSLTQKMIEAVDAYFNIRSQVAIVVPGSACNGSEGVRLQASQTVGWQTALKMTSYMAYFINRLVTALFPQLKHNRRVIQTQAVLSSIPLLMLIAKVILRSIFHFYLIKESGQDISNTTPLGDQKTASPANFPTLKKEEISSPAPLSMPKSNSSEDRILPGVRETLDELLGGAGSVDSLPVYHYKDGLPEADEMTDPIMKTLAVNPRTKEATPCILIKMHCFSSSEEIRNKFPDKSQNFSKSIISLVILKPIYLNRPLMWEQCELYTLYPTFFVAYGLQEGNFTYEKDGGLAKSQTRYFQLLQRIIKEGHGEDKNGIRWEIIGHKNTVK